MGHSKLLCPWGRLSCQLVQTQQVAGWLSFHLWAAVHFTRSRYGTKRVHEVTQVKGSKSPIQVQLKCHLLHGTFPNPSHSQPFNLLQVKINHWAWCCIPVISALQRVRQKGHEFETNLGYVVSPTPAYNTQ